MEMIDIAPERQEENIAARTYLNNKSLLNHLMMMMVRSMDD